MNLRNAGVYNIGLDIGTASVGWAVTDENGELLHFKGKPAWGSRLFPGAETAATARTHRGQRRRYQRRRWRLDLLQGIFEEPMQDVDPEFFIRLNQSRLHPEDRASSCSDYHWPLFNGTDFTELDYYARFPTVYHLRQWLMTTNEKADIRLIYLAFHNIVKYRGNFLQQGNEGLSSKNTSMEGAVEGFCEALGAWCDQRSLYFEADERLVESLSRVLGDTKRRRSDIQKDIAKLLTASGCGEGSISSNKKQAEKFTKAIAGAAVGLSAELADVFYLDKEVPEGLTTKIYLSNDENVESFSERCADEDRLLFDAMRGVYSAFILQGILSERPGESLSANKVEEYKRYGSDLKCLKKLVSQYAPQEYDRFFRGPYFEGTHRYDPAKADGYTRYDISHSAGSYEALSAAIKKLFAQTDAEEDERYLVMMDALESGRFLRRLKTSDNGSIPYQLHLEEMEAIIDHQKKFHPFLGEHEKKLCSLVTFRIPYYVGPLTKKNARRVRDIADGKLRFAWSERFPGKEDEKIYPWNWEEVIDKTASAERFIRRMTGTCTYIQGEPVLPKCSLLYEEFCVLNELNGARYTQDGDREYRFDAATRLAIVEELFKRGGSVSYKSVENWLERNGYGRLRVSGGQGEKGFESRLSSYGFFCKKVFDVKRLPEGYMPMVEEIIQWNTLFEDRDILREKIEGKYGDVLDARQIGVICRKRFAGWGKLSKKLLTDLKTQTDCGRLSIMNILREGNPTNGRRSKAMVFMEVLHDDYFDFEQQIEELNRAWLEGNELTALDELPGSPALRRAIRQALGVVEEIVGIAGHAPENIFIEVTREEGEKGKRTKKRYDALKQAIDRLREDNPEWWDREVANNLRSIAHSDLDEKLTLYFIQGGKSLYSGKPLDFGDLSRYQVDHILPQSYIKDDSLDNKALVLPEENQRKSDQMLLPVDMRRKMRPYWDALKSAKLISEKKYRNLTRESVSDGQMKGFINRQLVETSQIIKLVQDMLSERYPDARIRAIRASLSSELRGRLSFVKSREANDFHHAHDALIASEIGRFIQKRYPDMFDRPIRYAKAVRSFVKQQSEEAARGTMPGDSGFIVSSFLKPGFDVETGEILHDVWDAKAEIARLKKYLDCRQCYITRMPEETSGEFWKATIYSPRHAKSSLPLKKGLDPKKYGGYTSEEAAYFFIYEVVKKDKRALEFGAVPVSLAKAIEESADVLDEYARSLAEEKGFKYEKIYRDKIYKNQIIEVDGSRLYITGKQEVKNAVQVALTQHQICVLETPLFDERVDGEALNGLFESITTSINEYSPRLAAQLKIGTWAHRFAELEVSDKREVLQKLLDLANAHKSKVDLKVVGAPSGRMEVKISGLWAKAPVALIDQSITGMFERRGTIGL